MEGLEVDEEGNSEASPGPPERATVMHPSGPSKVFSSLLSSCTLLTQHYRKFKPEVLSSFLRLPQEIRDIVYDLVTADLPTELKPKTDRILAPVFEAVARTATFSLPGNSAPFPIVTFLPSLAYADRFVYRDLVPAYLRRTTLKLASEHDIHFLEELFDTLPESPRWSYITSLSVLDFANITRTPARAKEAMDAIASAANLEHLTIGLHLHDFYFPPAWPEIPVTREEARVYMEYPPRTLSARRILRDWELDRLFQAPRLSKISIFVGRGVFGHTDKSLGTLGDLLTAMAAGFKRMPGVQDVDPRYLYLEGDTEERDIDAIVINVARN